ncbi:hypothetical protein KC357_g215 [Hortaea werneckii]|nr:hypothetical protein KC357_g215 [Hortaea werneckii]
MPDLILSSDTPIIPLLSLPGARPFSPPRLPHPREYLEKDPPLIYALAYLLRKKNHPPSLKHDGEGIYRGEKKEKERKEKRIFPPFSITQKIPHGNPSPASTTPTTTFFYCNTIPIPIPIPTSPPIPVPVPVPVRIPTSIPLTRWPLLAPLMTQREEGFRERSPTTSYHQSPSPCPIPSPSIPSPCLDDFFFLFRLQWWWIGDPASPSPFLEKGGRGGSDGMGGGSGNGSGSGFASGRVEHTQRDGGGGGGVLLV